MRCDWTNRDDIVSGRDLTRDASVAGNAEVKSDKSERERRGFSLGNG
jgi:hypothetical protein